ncbi:MAG: hypothetical protein CMN28_02415 [Salinisphaeraceae bacterium]|nr:hypothetical protein [Salinisphaeraceae bacterium]
MLAAAFVGAGVVTAAVWISTQTPSLGVSWRADGERVYVAHVRAGPALGRLRPGQSVTAIAGTADSGVTLEPVDLTPEPDMVFKRYSAMDEFFERQSRLHAALQSPVVELLTTQGVIQVTPRPDRALSSLPPVFWFQLVCGLIGLLAGASVWAYRHRDPAARYYALTGLGLMSFASAASVYSTRELAIDGRLFMGLSALNEMGALLFCGGLIAVLWYYPTRLARLPAGPWIVGMYLAFGLAIPLRLHDSVELIGHMPIMAGYLLTLALAAAQWRKTRNDPLERAALRWFLLSWLFGSGAFLGFVYVPAALGYDSGAIQGYAFGFFALIHVGVAFGVLRYRLFRLDRWWFVAWAVFAGGLIVIALDLLLIYVLSLNAHLSLLASMAIAGWVYFPIRQWLMSRVTTTHRARSPNALLRLVTGVLARPEDDSQTAWRALLSQAFLPARFGHAPPETRDSVAENGLILNVAGDDDVPAQQLHFCQHGTRLFNVRDVELLADVRALFAELLRYRQGLEYAVAAERHRVACDLHDDVGARLLTLAHLLDEPYADRVRDALTELRSVVYSMQPHRMPLVDALGDWRAEVAERCEAAGVVLDWQTSGECGQPGFSGGGCLALTRVLREAVTNAIRHARPARLAVMIELTDTALACAVRHAYAGVPPEQWEASVGLGSLRERIARHGGTLNWQLEQHELVTRWSMPFPPPAFEADKGSVLPSDAVATSPDGRYSQSWPEARSG